MPSQEILPMVDLKLQYQRLKAEIEPAVLAVMESAHYIQGPNVTAFEEEAAKYLGTRYALGLANGTDALFLALKAYGIGAGDEVITPSFTFIATVEAILYTGATPIFIDIDPTTFNLDIKQIERLITPKTKAIMPVHLYGNPVDMPALMQIAKQHHLKVIEDCAQSFGATWQGQMTGSFGDCAAFSFYPTKNLSCFGDGGLIATNSEHIYQEILALRSHGSYVRYHHKKLGHNCRLDEIQAAILRIKLRYLNEFNTQRANAAQHYSAALEQDVTTPNSSSSGQHIFHQYTVLHPRRDDIMTALKAANISSMIYYPIPIHRQDLFAGQYDQLVLPVTDDFTAQCLSLPIYPELTLEQIHRVTDVIKKTVNS